MFGTLAYIHSDRGTSFMPQEVKNFLTTNGNAFSRTTPYNPQGNVQAERYNGINWKTVQLALKNKNLPVSHWEAVLNESSALPQMRLHMNECSSLPHYHLPSHEQDYTPSDPTPLQNNPAPTVETHLPKNATTPQSITAPALQNVASRRLPAYL
ncbi:hypothetical protein ILUMI_20438 [Ignelater luminosus]|uniref:Integrase catalytic domain-containing protein n=1 Tax=Ignelater luminosus TaxID=2038154 RepID=A0A8K0G4K4_IGNLU|nr:hypothetical protein ILUMI_20438 [Ignelater luminosus]